MKNIKFNWSKKNIIIVSAVAAAVIIAVVLTLVFTLGGSAAKMESRYKSSVKSVTSVVKTAEIKDGETSVEKRVETITFSKGDEADIVTAITKINQFNAKKEESTTTASGEIDRTSLVAVNLGTSVFESDYTYKGNTFKGKVSAENVTVMYYLRIIFLADLDCVFVNFKGIVSFHVYPCTFKSCHSARYSVK